MPNVTVPIVGPTYTSRSTSIANQDTRNFYIEVDRESDTIAAFVPFPGLKPFADTSGSFGKGLGKYNNQLYAVTDNNLYKVASDATITNIGSVQTSDRCVLETDNSRLIIATGASKPYAFDGSSLTLGSDIDLAESSTVTYINNRVVYDGNNPDVIFAEPGNALSVNSLNVTSEDGKPDDTLAVKAFRDQVFVFGEESITPYYNSGTGNPPFNVIQNATANVGIGAIHSISTNYRSLYFLGSDLMVYRIAGIQPEPIGNPAIGQAISSYQNPDLAYGVCFSFNNQYFYLLTFPGDASWLYTEGAGWTRLAYGVNGLPHLISDYQYCYGKHLVSDRQSGIIYELDFDTFTDNSEVIQRRRDTRKISGKDFGFPGKEIYMDRLELVVETGTGLISGQGEDPRIMMSFSDDGGRTWSPEQWGYIGKMGSFTYGQNPYWTDLGAFYERQFRFTVTDPVKVVLISANADISVGT